LSATLQAYGSDTHPGFKIRGRPPVGAGASRIQVSSYSFEPPFNLAKKRKFALSLVQTEDLIILNDDVEVIAPDWMQAMFGLTGRTEIGANPNLPRDRGDCAIDKW
jgi:hypothetical protein